MGMKRGRGVLPQLLAIFDILVIRHWNESRSVLGGNLGPLDLTNAPAEFQTRSNHVSQDLMYKIEFFNWS